MAEHTCSIPCALRSGFLQLFLLLSIIALPSFAFAVDSDGDGVDDSLDAFPNKFEASVDTDHDGKPNGFLQVKGFRTNNFFEDFEGTFDLSVWTVHSHVSTQYSNT